MEIKVLLVEDQVLTRMGLKVILDKAEGITLIKEAENGLEGVEIASKYLPDVILMDIGMPEMDGIEATKRIKELSLNSKVLMFTSRDSEKDVFDALSAGADGYIMKDATPEQIITAIKTVNDGAAWLDASIARMVLSAISKPASQPTTQEISDDSSEFIKSVGLTPRELEVLKLIVDGYTNSQISEKLVIAFSTAKAHVHNILQKLSVLNKNQATALAMRKNLV